MNRVIQVELPVANIIRRAQREAVSLADVTAMLLPTIQSQIAEHLRQVAESNKWDTAMDAAGLVVWCNAKDEYEDECTYKHVSHKSFEKWREHARKLGYELKDHQLSETAYVYNWQAFDAVGNVRGKFATHQRGNTAGYIEEAKK